MISTFSIPRVNVKLIYNATLLCLIKEFSVVTMLVSIYVPYTSIYCQNLRETPPFPTRFCNFEEIKSKLFLTKSRRTAREGFRMCYSISSKVLCFDL